MAYHSGTLIDGDPVFCGGNNGSRFDVKCFLLNVAWKRVNSLEITLYSNFKF